MSNMYHVSSSNNKQKAFCKIVHRILNWKEASVKYFETYRNIKLKVT